MKKPAVVLLLLALLVMAAAPTAAQGPEANLIDECVTDYDPDVNYFPNQVEFDYAEGIEVEYFNHYKVVRVLQPYLGAEEPLEYVLVQCGTPAPDAADFAENAQFIEVPTGDIIAMSTSHLPPLNELGLLDNLIGLDSFLYVSTPAVRDLIDAGELIEVGSGPAVNVEMVLDAEPDLVMASAYGPEDAPALLMDAGVFTAVNSEWIESSMLARAEWIKYVALFYNMEAEATAFFDGVVEEYNAIAALTADIPAEERVTVLWNAYSTWGEAWDIPGQQTWAGYMLADAGADYVLMDEAPEFSVPLDFEVVYDAGLDADIWVTNLFGVMTLDDLLAQDARYADFAAVENGTVYNNTGRVNENGGNDFWENGITHPEDLLADLVAMFYPELLPDHDLIYFIPLEPTE